MVGFELDLCSSILPIGSTGIFPVLFYLSTRFSVGLSEYPGFLANTAAICIALIWSLWFIIMFDFGVEDA